MFNQSAFSFLKSSPYLLKFGYFLRTAAQVARVMPILAKIFLMVRNVNELDSSPDVRINCHQMLSQVSNTRIGKYWFEWSEHVAVL